MEGFGILGAHKACVVHCCLKCAVLTGLAALFRVQSLHPLPTTSNRVFSWPRSLRRPNQFAGILDAIGGVTTQTNNRHHAAN